MKNPCQTCPHYLTSSTRGRGEIVACVQYQDIQSALATGYCPGRVTLNAADIKGRHKEEPPCTD